ncbi:MAG: thiamine pyrophosphate-binding protein [candidate division KSB1 bacterium]|nr:thiamine pyrophosphate-binding protein [candidate division KSB1 bacterium]MDZ7368247.1 thiamine pyrophosphate-binding protein [candidate division KSB1 bacterium]MDZ7406771.1 thiamine pyrophosphate-binding protein [candidate division KSB1 bacterium]
MKSTTGGEIIASMLANEGVEKVFGIIDGTYFGLYSNLKKFGIELISPRHEACALHIAGAYARLTGKLGVAIASNGPGVANALSGVAVENGEGNRVLLITSTRRTGIGYPDRGGTYQYFNQVGAIKPISKWSGVAASFNRLQEMMRRAFRISYHGRPGVVHVDVPEDLMNGKTEAQSFVLPSRYRRLEAMAASEAQIERAAEMLVAARLPMIHAGSGVIHSGAFAELQTVAEILHAPVTTSWGGRSVFPETHELAMPMIYIKLNHQVRNAADLVLTLGSRLGETDWWGKPPYWASPAGQKMIQVDIDEEILGLNKPVDLAVLSDIKIFLAKLLEKLPPLQDKMPLAERRKAVKKFQAARAKFRREFDAPLKDKSAPMNPAHVAAVCRRFFPDDAVCVIDGGNTAVWAHFFHEARVPNTILQTAKFGMLGAGVAQALGAAVAFPERQIYCIIGDGAMGFNLQEIETAVRNKLKVIYLVCCDKQWGMVKMNQQFALKPVKTLVKKSLAADETINADLSEIQFDKLAASMGAHGERVADPQELQPALERSRAAGKCAVIHVDVNPVKHLWAPGLIYFKEMHKEPKGK